MNSVKWGNLKSENEFIKNILKYWKTIELSDILFMLSRKFSVNNIYPNSDTILNNLDGMKELRKFAVKKLGEHSNEELNFILLQLVQAIRYEDISSKKIESPLVCFLIKTCSKDIVLASSFFWFIECEADNDISTIPLKNKNINLNNLKEIIKIYDLIRQKFSNNLSENYPEIFSVINNQKKFKNELVKISDSLTKVQKNENKKKELRNILANKNKIIQEEFFLPIDPHIKIKGTITDQCSVFKSAKCPCKYTFKVTEESKQYNPHEEKDNISVMFKYGDDLRQDQLILQMINFMDSLLKKVHLNYEFTSYKVLATSKSDGFVEFVPNSKTIFDILKKYNNVILSYYKEISSNDEKTLSKYLDSYINSCAGYCVITYILGIGDRHLENLMIDNKGRLFHIDFGYILGKDPKPAPPPIKLCQEMVEVMGGKGSSRYEEFKQKCVNAYWVLRENARVIVNMFYLMIDSGIPELNEIENLYKLHEKFVPGFSKQEASNSFLTNLEESVNALMPILMEKFHAWAQYWK
jgi:phosphatidylinositol 3-kinase